MSRVPISIWDAGYMEAGPRYFVRDRTMQVVLVTPGLVPPLHDLPYRNDVDARAAGSHY